MRSCLKEEWEWGAKIKTLPFWPYPLRPNSSHGEKKNHLATTAEGSLATEYHLEY